jgi:hypothetical protein
MAILPKALCVQCNPYQNLNDSLHRDFKKCILKYIWKQNRPQTAKEIPSKKSSAGGITIHDFKVYYRAITIKTVWYWHKNRHEVQWIRKLIHKPTQLWAPQRSTKHTMEKRQPLQQMLLGKKNIHIYKTETISLSLTLHQNHPKWIKDLNMRPETLKQFT